MFQPKIFFFYSQVISNIKRSIRSSRSRSFSTSKRMNQTQQQTLSIRSEYDVTKNGDQCYKSLIAPTADESEVLELKESSRNGDVFHDGSQVDKQYVITDFNQRPCDIYHVTKSVIRRVIYLIETRCICSNLIQPYLYKLKKIV